MVCVADDVASSLRAVALAERHPVLVATAGIHPHEAAKASDRHFDQLRQIVGRAEVVAVGEIGLDYHYDFAPVEVQKEVFRRQLRLAKDVGLPVVVHSREAEDDVLSLLEAEGAHKIGGVLHCFWGSAEAAARALELGFHLGVGGPVTFKNAEELRRVLGGVPTDRLLVETDAPYLAPVPYRGKRNEPAFVVHTGIALAGVVGVDPDELAQRTTANAARLFGLDVAPPGA